MARDGRPARRSVSLAMPSAGPLASWSRAALLVTTPLLAACNALIGLEDHEVAGPGAGSGDAGCFETEDVIDDDADTRANLRDILELDGYEIEMAGSVAETLNRNNWSEYSAIVLDRKLPDGSADELLPQLKQLAPEAAILIVTGHSDLQGAITAIRQGAADYITKPINPDLIRNRLAHVAEQKRARAEIGVAPASAITPSKKARERFSEAICGVPFLMM